MTIVRLPRRILTQSKGLQEAAAEIRKRKKAVQTTHETWAMQMDRAAQELEAQAKRIRELESIK